MPVEQQHKEMEKFTIDKKIDYYLAAMRYIHPPPVGLADNIAKHGKAALPFLMKRLREERNESNQVHLMSVFESMHLFYYNLKDEKEVHLLLKEKIDSMKNLDHKKSAENILKDIRENQVPNPEKVLSEISR